jgi:voltage-gated potassium channel
VLQFESKSADSNIKTGG